MEAKKQSGGSIIFNKLSVFILNLFPLLKQEH